MKVSGPGTSWTKFLDLITTTARGTWAFRGEADIGYVLRPKIGRPDFNKTTKYDLNDEIALFKNFKFRLQKVDPSIDTDLEFLALAQHHGLPTRLLDWSSNPLVAAYFATTTDKDNVQGRIYAVRLGMDDIFGDELPPDGTPLAPFDKTRSSPIFVRVPPHAARITAQQGFFSLHTRPTEIWDIKAQHPSTIDVTVEANEKEFFRDALRRVGVDRSRMMTDIDALCGDLQYEYLKRPPRP